MAKKAAKEKKSPGNKKSTTVADLPVDFGGISLGKDTARIGVSVALSVIDLQQAFDLLVGHRLICAVTLDKSNDAKSGQQRIVDDLDLKLEVIADVNGMRVTPDLIAAGLTMSLKDLDLEVFAKFSKGKGRLIVNAVERIDVSDENNDEHDEGDGDEGLDLEE